MRFEGWIGREEDGTDTGGIEEVKEAEGMDESSWKKWQGEGDTGKEVGVEQEKSLGRDKGK